MYQQYLSTVNNNGAGGVPGPAIGGGIAGSVSVPPHLSSPPRIHSNFLMQQHQGFQATFPTLGTVGVGGGQNNSQDS